MAERKIQVRDGEFIQGGAMGLASAGVATLEKGHIAMSGLDGTIEPGEDKAGGYRVIGIAEETAEASFSSEVQNTVNVRRNKAFLLKNSVTNPILNSNCTAYLEDSETVCASAGSTNEIAVGLVVGLQGNYVWVEIENRSNSGSGGSIGGTKSITVEDSQTIQEVIDALPVMQGDLVSGITNPYIIKVPPGHEKEYYSLVRNASDVASDKRNVKVIFEDNPDGKFIVDQFESCDVIGDWYPYSPNSLTLDSSNKFEGSNCFKLSGTDSLKCAIDGHFDFRAYHGLLIDIRMDTNETNFITTYLYSGSDSISRSSQSITGTAIVDRTYFFPFVQSSANTIDYSDITHIRFSMGKSGYSGTHVGYIDNIRLIRTTPHLTAILRFDDAYASDFSVGMKGLDGYGWKGNFAIIASYVDRDDGKLSLSECKRMDAGGHILINHTFQHPLFNEIGEQETYQEYTIGANFLRINGFTTGDQLLVNPSTRSNLFLENLLIEDGVLSTYSKNGIFPVLEFSGSSTPSTTLEAFISQKKGGIVQFVFHATHEDETAYQTMLAWINSNFSKIITLPEVADKIPSEMFTKKKNNFSYRKLGYTGTLTDIFEIKNYYGDSFFLDPGGANRDIIPIGSFNPFCEKRIINTADAAETLTFDPLFTSSGTADNTSDLLTFSTGAWVAGQLVGRTVNNITDGSSGIITANTATTITVVLSGGTNNTWTTGDSFIITPVGSNQDIAQGNSQVFIYDGEGWH